jgi:hypothetical protein
MEAFDRFDPKIRWKYAGLHRYMTPNRPAARPGASEPVSEMRRNERESETPGTVDGVPALSLDGERGA